MSIWEDTDDADKNPVYNGNLTFDGSGDFSYNAPITGSIAVTKNGSGNLALNASNAFSGNTTINNGDLSIGGSGQLGSGTYVGAISIASGSTFSYASSSNQTLSGVISGAGDLEKVTGTTSTLTLSTTNTYSGDTTINAGTLKLTGALSTSTDLVIGTSGTLDLQATQTFATLDLDGAISRSAGSSALTISGTSNIGGNITTSGTQTYTGAVTLSDDITLTTSNSNVIFSSTVASDAIGTKRDLTLTLGSGSATFNDIVGGTSLADIILNSSATFNAAVTADNLTIAANKTATVKDDVTVASNITLNNSSTLEVINTSAMTISGTILENGGSATSTAITVKFNTADTAPSKVTFSGTVTADSIKVGDAAAATYAGYAHFTGSGGVTVGEARVTSGDHTNEYSTLQFDYAVTASDQIVINDKIARLTGLFDLSGHTATLQQT